jgi:type IV pilus assembly protein PilX
MRNPDSIVPAGQRGVVLIAALLLLIVMTILAMTMFRTNGVQELIAGNVREKQRALQTAQDAEQYAEIWLATGQNTLSNSSDCSSVTLVAYTATSIPYICVLPVAAVADVKDVTSVPWQIGGTETGFQFFPGSTAAATGDMTVSATPGNNSYQQVPRFYIALLQSSARQAMYRIDAWNWGGTTGTAAVVESNYVVTCSICGFN